MPKKLELTRRRVLAGLGTIGVASAGAGLGTSAYLNDTESFVGNSLTAGTLNLQVDYQWAAVDSFHLEANGGDLPSPSGDAWGTLDGNSVSLEATDVKPGDWAVLCFRLRVEGNPAYLKAMGEITADGEVNVNEPEYYHSTENNSSANQPGMNPTFDASDTEHGELDEAIHVSVGTAYNDTDGLVNAVDVGSLNDFVSTLDGWVLRGEGGLNESGNATVVGPGEANEIPFCIMFRIPPETGNEIQSDTVSFDVGFAATQARHQDGSDVGNITF